MAKYRQTLPQLSDKLFLTDAGMETTLIFHDGMDLPLLRRVRSAEDRRRHRDTRRYYARYRELARDANLGFVLESPTWRANCGLGAASSATRARRSPTPTAAPSR